MSRYVVHWVVCIHVFSMYIFTSTEKWILTGQIDLMVFFRGRCIIGINMFSHKLIMFLWYTFKILFDVKLESA